MWPHEIANLFTWYSTLLLSFALALFIGIIRKNDLKNPLIAFIACLFFWGVPAIIIIIIGSETIGHAKEAYYIKLTGFYLLLLMWGFFIIDLIVKIIDNLKTKSIIKYIIHLTDSEEHQSELKILLLNNSKTAIRLAVLQKLNDQATLIQLVREDIDLEIRKAAVMKITDWEVLADIVINGDKAIREAIIENLTDQKQLSTLVAKLIDSLDYKKAQLLKKLYKNKYLSSNDKNKILKLKGKKIKKHIDEGEKGRTSHYDETHYRNSCGPTEHDDHDDRYPHKDIQAAYFKL